MIIEQIYTGCLFQASYYIESNGESAIIDPIREVDLYIDKARNNNSKIKYVFETHFHADFVSGHLTLSKKTNSKIIFGPNAKPNYECTIANDNDEFTIGDLTIKVLHTPGHTLESVTYLLKDSEGKDYCIFTGDTLFLGDVGRPDLAQVDAEINPEIQAGMLFDSIQNKISVLDDDVIVYPAHGAGSACGKNMMKITFDSLGNQKKINYALNGSCNREEFIDILTKDLPPPPEYFPSNVSLNINGYSDIDKILLNNSKSIPPSDFKNIIESDEVLILDTRSPEKFSDCHIPNSIFIGIDGSFAPWVGEILKDIKIKILVVVDDNRETEVFTRLSRVGFDNYIGYLSGGINSWIKNGYETQSIENISPDEFVNIMNEIKILDVRNEGEINSSSLDNSIKIPLKTLENNLYNLNQNNKYYIHCAGGYRSMIAASLMKKNGFNNLVNVSKGYSGIKKCLINI